MPGTQLIKYDRNDGTEVESFTAGTDAPGIFMIDASERFYAYSSTSTTKTIKRLSISGSSTSADWSATKNLRDNNLLIRSRFNATVDSLGNCYLVGNVYSGTHGGFDYYGSVKLYKFNASGTELWSFTKVAPFTGPGYEEYNPAAICVDLDGNVHVTGRSMLVTASDSSTGRFEVHIDSSGNELWSDIDPGDGTSTGGLRSGYLCVSDENGNTLVAYNGYVGTTGTEALKQYDPDGNVDFTRTTSQFTTPDFMDYFDSKLCTVFRATSSLSVVRQYGGSEFSTTDWTGIISDTTSTTNNIRCIYDANGKAYVTYLASSPLAMHRLRYSSSGTLEYDESTNNQLPGFPMVPPGRAIYA